MHNFTDFKAVDFQIVNVPYTRQHLWIASETTNFRECLSGSCSLECQ